MVRSQVVLMLIGCLINWLIDFVIVIAAKAKIFLHISDSTEEGCLENV